MSEPRAPVVRPDGKFMSVGFDDTNDTLLRMPDRPEGWGDWGRAAAWALAVEAALARLAKLEGRSE